MVSHPKYSNDPKFLGQIGLGEQYRHRSDCSCRSSLIRVFTVCSSIGIFLAKYLKVLAS